MEQLLELLSEIEQDETIPHIDKELPIVEEISILAQQLLITKSGNCHWSNINLLEDIGYHVFPVESDGFGWMLGGIQTTKGIITYG